MKYFLSESGRHEQQNAIQKPRSDSEKTMIKLGFEPVYISYGQDAPFTKHFKRYYELKKFSKQMKKGDFFLVQHPALRNTIFLKQFLNYLNNKGVITIALIHDLNYIRLNRSTKFKQKIALSWKDKETLKSYSKVIVHNKSMGSKVQEWGIPSSRIVKLNLFDYLTNDRFVEKNQSGVVIAGNLIAEKARYIYNLPNSPQFNLYGINYKDERSNNGDNVHYMGVYEPENISVMKGRFGLVWDGSSIHTCAGDFGEYLKYNNPFKASTYLAAGLPIIVWKHSALANFVQKNNCGFIIDDLANLSDRIEKLNSVDYSCMQRNALAISQKIREGAFLTQALEKITDKEKSGE